jgi:hypothetical protein
MDYIYQFVIKYIVLNSRSFLMHTRKFTARYEMSTGILKKK